MSSPTSLKGTVSESEAFLQNVKKHLRVWECAAGIAVDPAQCSLKGRSHVAIIRRSRAHPNSLPLAHTEDLQRQEMITVFYERAVIPSSLLFAGENIILLNYISFDSTCAVLNPCT